MLFNVNTRAGNPDKVIELIRKTEPDFFTILEADRAWTNRLSQLEQTYPHKIVRPRSDNFGIALYSRYPVEGDIVFIGAAGVPSIKASVGFPEGQVRLLATHPLPPSGAVYAAFRNDQLEKLPTHFETRRFLLAGDLNTTPWAASFRLVNPGGILLHSMKGHGPVGTWPAFFPPMGVPLDHVLHTPDIRVTNWFTDDPCGSDHKPVFVDFHIEPEA